jgi:serpin B
MNYLQKAASYLLILILFVSCSETPEEPQDYEPIRLDLKSQEIVNTTNDFGFDLFKEIINENGNENLMISSLSVAQALGMTWNGAQGATRDEMTQMLGFSVDNEKELNNSNKTIREALLKADNMVEMKIANSIWFRNTFSVDQGFVDINREYYDAEVKALDFNDVAGSKKIINGWVSDRTNGRIPAIVDRINPEDIMFLINAVYFKGKWKYEFKKDDTVDELFYYADGSKAEVKMMVQEASLGYFGNSEYKGLILPYGNGHFNMVVLLPDAGNDLKDIIAELNDQDLSNEIHDAAEMNVKVWLPKFKFEYEAELKSPLTKLGMVTAFSDIADLSGIGSPSNLTISSVKHKTFVEVNEEGTEAAAVTSVTVGVTSVGPGEGMPEFKVNRPFLFLIKEKDTGAILFTGQVYTPGS